MKNSTFSAQVANNLLTLLQGYSKTIRLLLVMFLTLTASTAWGAKITTYSSIVTGKTYYIGATTGGTDYYLSVSGASTSISIAGTAVTTKANATAFVFTGSGTSWNIKFADYANYLGLKSSKDNGKVQVVSSAATFTASNQSGKLRLSIGSYSIQKNNSGTQFGSYGNTQTDIWLEEVSGSDEPTTTYTIKWHTAVGETTDVTLEEGATITKPATDPTMTGYEFMGWTEDCEVASNGAGFTAITNFGTATEDKNYYAVFAVATTTSGGGSSQYEKVTSNLADWAGDYLIAYNNTTFADGRIGGTGTGAMGASGVKVDLSSSISNNTIPASVGDQYNVTLEAVSGGYVLKTKDGKYNYQSSNSNGLTATTNISTATTYAIKVTFTSENDIKLALSGGANGAVFRYNTSGYFRFYKNGGQSAVYLYKKVAGGSTTTYSDYITTCAGSTPEPDPIPVTGVSLDITSHTMNEGETVTLTATVTPDDADDKTITWKSSDENIAKVNTNGVVTAVSPGTATITVTTTDGGHTATCTIKVNALPPVGGTWTLVTNAANLKAGDRIVIAAADTAFALSTTQNNNNRGQAAVTKNGNNITFTEATQIITLVATDNADVPFAFSTGDAGYLYAASSSGNQLKTKKTLDDHGKWAITINADTASIIASTSTNRNVMQYNKTNGLFACYASASQEPIAIYKEDNTPDPVQLATPTGLSATKITSTGATLSWNTVEYASSYTVSVYGENDEVIAEYTGLTKTTKDVSELDPETNYVFGVVAVGDGITYTNSIQAVSDVFTTLKATTPTAGYTIIHSRQALDDSYPDSLIVKTTGTADVGSTITAEKKTYNGFVCNDEVQTITIQADAAQNVVTYKYVRQSYTLTWDLDGGTIIAEGTPAGTVKYGAPLTAPTVEKAGYRFDHWNPNVPATMQDGNRTYKAFYTQQHTVKWVSQGTVIRTDTYDTGAALEAAPTTGIVECDGKTHVGWTAQGGYAHSTAAPADLFTESSGTVTADATYYAVYAEGSGGGGTGWTAVTSTSNLEAGATYAISNEATGGTYLSTWDGGNNFDGSTITICPLILGGSEGAWTFQISDESTHNDKYLTATSAASNRLKAVNPVDNYSYFTISFDNNGNAVITCTGKNTNNILRYNANNGSPIFACYSSGQDNVYLQKLTGGGGYTNYTTSCASITSIRIEGQITTFDQYDAFNFGGKVYAIDEEDNETDVTELATFTGYDMSQAGTQTVTVRYSGCSVTYEITVNKLPVWNITWSVGGKTDTGIGPREVVQGKTIGECSSTGNLQIPKIPDACKGKYFMGWSASSTVNSDGSDFTPITSATVPETNVTYYAVFAEPTGNGGAQGELFSESFETIEGSGGNDGQWDGNIASAQLTEHGNWVFSYAYKGDECIKLGKASGQGEATTPALDINGNATLTFAAGAWNGNSENLTINLQIVGEGSIKPSSVTLTKGQFNTYTANITDANADTKVQFIAANAATNRFFLDEVKVSGGSSDSYTDYSTSCGTYTVTFYGFNSGGYTTICNGNHAVDEVEQGGTYVIPNCEPTFDPAGLGRTFAGTWNTQANGKGTEYEPGDEFIVNSDITLYAQWALNTSENTTLPTDVEDLATTDIVVTGGTTLTLQADTTTINSLTLKGGLQENGTYAMPVVNIPNGATLVRNNNKINLDLKVNNNSYYPFAVPFEVANTAANVNYINPTLKEYANANQGYGKFYRILEYNGALRAENGVNSAENWVHVGRTDVKLMPGKGYAISAVPAAGDDTVTIRITMTVDNAWLANGEQESITVKETTTTRNKVTVTAYTGDAATEHKRHAGWNFVANPYLTNFAGSEASNEDGSFITGELLINKGDYSYGGDDVPYVTIPTYNFEHYYQRKLSDATLSPAYSFFVQVGKSGTMTFETAGRQQAPASIAARNAEERPVKMDVDITLSDNHSSDQTGIIISDRYSEAYEIGRDLEKLFGSAYNLSVYTLMADNTPLAFQALAIRSNMQVIPVGYRAPEQGEYTFRLNEATSSIDLLNEQYEQLVLVDYQTGELTNLLIADYTFYSERTQADNRFAIYAVPRQNAPTDLPNAIGQDKQAQKIIHNGHLYILRDGNVYNGNGQIVK